MREHDDASTVHRLRAFELRGDLVGGGRGRGAERAADRLTRGRVVLLWVIFLVINGRYDEALQYGNAYVETLGWDCPRSAEDVPSIVAVQLERIIPPLLSASAAELEAWPKCTDPEATIVGMLLAWMTPAAAFGKPEIFPVRCFAMLEHTVRHGIARTTVCGARAGALMAVFLLQDLGLAQRFIQFGQFHEAESEGFRAFSIHAGGLAKQYLHPLLALSDEWLKGAEIGFREGDIVFGEYIYNCSAFARMISGQPLRLHPPLPTHYHTLAGRVGADFMVSIRAGLSAPNNQEAWSKVHWLATFPTELPLFLHLTRTVAALVAVHLAADVKALEYVTMAEPHWQATGGSGDLIVMVFILCLMATAYPQQSEAFKKSVELHRARLEKWAAFTPKNFRHMKLLVDAWEARNEGRHVDAENLFEASTADARENGFLNDEALALRMFGEYFLERNMHRAAKGYLIEAYETYLRWGAIACANAVKEKYPQFFLDTHGNASGETTLDVHTAIRAAQALSSELDPERVVGRLMELCIANAGAQRGALVLMKNGELVVVARLSVADSRIETGLSEAVTSNLGVPETVVRYVARSREPLVVHDMSTENRFTADAYLATHAVRSLLTLPLAHRGNLVGVLYLEHGDAPSAFPPARVELLSVLASQSAIAVENAQQVRVLEVRNREVQELNDELRRQIAQRSRRLIETLLPRDGAAQMVSHAEGTILGDCYRVVRLIGEGGMGIVYEVERTTDGKHLAAKVLNHAPDRSDLGRFAREAEILAKLAHPNLISIYDIDVTDQGVLYIVMEFVSGTVLGQVQGRKGDVPWVVQVVAQVARALQVLHSIAIVHRDLKPDNILVVTSEADKPPLVKLADFGISIMLDDVRINVDALVATAEMNGATARRSHLTQTGALVGTPLYMAPELGYGSRNAQPSADIFALGIIAFELFMGRKPYPFPPVLGGTVEADVADKLGACPGLSADIAQLVAQCLDMNPAQRPTADEVATRLATIPMSGPLTRRG